MQLNSNSDTDERGVSPVIGVILMVAITVILAAVIGAFVLNLGSNLRTTGPQAQISISDASGQVSDGDVFTLSHNGGDTLQSSELKMIVTKKDGTAITTFDPITTPPTSSSYSWNSAPSTTISTGDSFTFHQTSSGSITQNEQLTVKIIDTQSNSIVAQSTVTVN